MRENFEKYGDRLPIARQLVTLQDDVDFEFDAGDVPVRRAERRRRCKPHLRELRLHEPAQAARRATAPKHATPQAPTPQREVPAVRARASSADGRRRRRSRDSAADAGRRGIADVRRLHVRAASTRDEKFDAFLDELKKQKRFAFDTETDALGAMQSHARRHELQLGARHRLLRPRPRPGGVAAARRASACCAALQADPRRPERSRRSATTSSTTCWSCGRPA